MIHMYINVMMSQSVAHLVGYHWCSQFVDSDYSQYASNPSVSFKSYVIMGIVPHFFRAQMEGQGIHGSFLTAEAAEQCFHFTNCVAGLSNEV